MPYEPSDEQRKITEEALSKSIQELVNTKVNRHSAKGVDVFGRNKDQVELARLHHAGAKGIRVK